MQISQEEYNNAIDKAYEAGEKRALELFKKRLGQNVTNEPVKDSGGLGYIIFGFITGLFGFIFSGMLMDTKPNTAASIRAGAWGWFWFLMIIFAIPLLSILVH